MMQGKEGNPNWTNAPDYAVAPMRLEYRSYHPYVRSDLQRALEVIRELGIDAWWTGVMGDEGALYRSRAMPVHPLLEDDVLPWLSQECERSGITLVTHLCFEGGGGYGKLVARQHPEWKMHFLRNEAGEEADFADWPAYCPHSDYTRLLEDFVREIVGELGLKGVWFDSAPLSSRPWVGCCCPRCAEQFRGEMGYTMPERIDWTSADFRAFVDWRYKVTEGIWRRMSAAVRQANSAALVAINTYRRLHVDWHFGSCLQPLDFPVLVGGEDDGMCQQALLQMKYHRAMCSVYPPEDWQGLYSLPHYAALPNPEPEGRLLHQGLACLISGGYPSYGSGCHPALVTDTLKKLGDWIKPRTKWVGGEPLRYAGLVLSRHTQDFAHNGDATESWASVHGMHELLNQLHLPSEVLFDEHLEPESLRRYKLVVLPEVFCISDESARAVQEYVRTGGCVLATGRTGTLGFRGEPRERGVLDDLFGIAERDEAPEYPVILPGDRVNKDLPEMYAVFGKPCGVTARKPEDVLARFGWIRVPPENETDWTERNREGDRDALVVRTVGEGKSLYLAWDIGGGYLGAAHRRTRLLFQHLFAHLPPPPFRVVAPPWLVVTAWEQAGGRTVFHLLQAQGSPARFPESSPYTVLEEVSPVSDVGITLERPDVRRAWLPLLDLELPISRDTEGQAVTVTVPGVARHEILVFE